MFICKNQCGCLLVTLFNRGSKELYLIVRRHTILKTTFVNSFLVLSSFHMHFFFADEIVYSVVSIKCLWLQVFMVAYNLLSTKHSHLLYMFCYLAVARYHAMSAMLLLYPATQYWRCIIVSRRTSACPFVCPMSIHIFVSGQ